MRVVKDVDINEASQGGRKASTSLENLEGHVLKDLDEQLCGKLDERELTIPMMTSSSPTTRASCLKEVFCEKFYFDGINNGDEFAGDMIL